MATIRAYTTIEQSRKLAEILPLESADMHSEAIDINDDMVFIVVSGLGDKTKSNYGSPVWSLAALLNILPRVNIEKEICADNTYDYRVKAYGYIGDWFDNPVDACVDVIVKLHELKML